MSHSKSATAAIYRGYQDVSRWVTVSADPEDALLYVRIHTHGLATHLGNCTVVYPGFSLSRLSLSDNINMSPPIHVNDPSS